MIFKDFLVGKLDLDLYKYWRKRCVAYVGCKIGCKWVLRSAGICECKGKDQLTIAIKNAFAKEL